MPLAAFQADLECKGIILDSPMGMYLTWYISIGEYRLPLVYNHDMNDSEEVLPELSKKIGNKQ